MTTAASMLTPLPPLAPMVYPRARHLTAVTSLSGSTSWAVPLACPSPGREPLCPPPGVPWCGVIAGITSEGMTLPSSLLRAQASDQTPPAAFGRPSDHGSVPGVVRPCGQMARPGVLSAVLGEVPGPLPPPGPFGACARFFPKGFGLTSPSTGAAHTDDLRHATSTEEGLRGCRHAVMCRLPYVQDLQVAPTAVAYCPRAARSFPSRYGQVVTHHAR
jgi:hypothetical protein